MKIYTRTGDDGSTGLLGPGRVLKSDPRVEAYGSVDELNATLGGARALDTAGWLVAELETIQSRLFTIGAELATLSDELRGQLQRLADDDVVALETLIDRLEADLPPLTQFILPGGTLLAAHMHLARTVCRRAERRVVALSTGVTLDPLIVRYLNRLADLLFVMARWCNQRAGVHEIPWRSAPRG